MSMEWGEYVPVAERKLKARRYANKRAAKRGFPAQPIENLGRKITKTFWGNAWCENLERYSDFANRLPRGRTYARNGSIADLVIKKGKVNAIVGGSEVYKIEIKFSVLPKKKWNAIKDRCAGTIDSVISLLQGRFDESVMADLSRQKDGLFPSPREIEFACDCPDWAGMCKHIAAVLYRIGARLDQEPETLFLLRGVDHLELVTSQAGVDSLVDNPTDSGLANQDLSQIFGIEFDEGVVEADTTPSIASKKARAKKKTVKKKPKAAKKTKALRKPTAALGKKKVAKKTNATSPKKSVTKKKSSKKKSSKKKSTKKKTAQNHSSTPTTPKKATRAAKKTTKRKAIKKK